MTSAPSVTDIGLSGMRSTNSTSADQPVASAIGTSGTSARRTSRKIAQQHGEHGEQAGDERQQAPPVRGDLRVGLGGEHRQAGELARGRPRRRVVSSARITSMTSFCSLERHQPDAERQRRGRAGRR